MSHAVFGSEINRRRLRGVLCEKVLEGGLGAVDEEHRAGLGVQCFDVTESVLLLFHACQLVLFDEVVEVVLATGESDETDLAVQAHDLAIKVEGRLAVLLKPALGDEAKKIRPASGIDDRVVGVRSGWQLDFRLADAEKTEGIARGLFGCFLRRENVVRQFANALGQFGFRSQRGKGFDGRHKKLPRKLRRAASEGTPKSCGWARGNKA